MNSVSSNTATAVKTSPCDEAYDQLRCEFENHEAILDHLISRLASVLRDPAPVGTSKDGPTPVPNPAQSELHGRLLGAAKRVAQQSDALRDILDRLTI